MKIEHQGFRHIWNLMLKLRKEKVKRKYNNRNGLILIVALIKTCKKRAWQMTGK